MYKYYRLLFQHHCRLVNLEREKMRRSDKKQITNRGKYDEETVTQKTLEFYDENTHSGIIDVT